jgi:hypothetical protein
VGPACKQRVERDAGVKDVTRIDVDSITQRFEVGMGWSFAQKATSPQKCVEGDPNRSDDFRLQIGTAATTRPASTFPAPTPRTQPPPTAQPIRTGNNLRLDDDPDDTTTEGGPEQPAAPAASAEPTEGGPSAEELLRKFPTEEQLSSNDGYFENNYSVYLKATNSALNDNGPGLALADPAPIIPQPDAAKRLKDLQDLVSVTDCNETNVLTWIRDLRTATDDMQQTTVAVDTRTAVITSADSNFDALGVRGSASLKLLSGIGASLSGQVVSILDLDSNAISLFIDVLAAAEVETFRDAPPKGFNARGVRLNDLGNRLASNPSFLPEFKEKCGDNWIYALARGSRYAAKLTVSRSSMERTFRLDASGSLDGISLGPIQLDVSGQVKSTDFSKNINIAEASELFEQVSGSKPSPMPASAGCRLAYAAAIPRATRKGGPVVAFATAPYPAATGPLGNLNDSIIPAAKLYVELIERMGKFAHQIFEIRTMPYKYEFLTVEAVRAQRQKGETAYQALMGEGLEGAMNPLERWKAAPTDIGGQFGKGVKHARDGVKAVERAATPDERTAAANRMMSTYQADLREFTAIETAFGAMPRQSNQSYFALLTKGPRAAGKQALRLKATDGAIECDKLNRAAAFRPVNAQISGAGPWLWRLPAVSEVKRMRWGANGLLNNDLPRGDVFINAVRPASGPRASAFVQVDVAGTAAEPKQRQNPTDQDEVGTICVFAPLLTGE